MAPHASIEPTAVTDTEGVTLPNPLTYPVPINDVLGRRKVALQSQWGIAAHSNVDDYKIHKHDHKPRAKRWDHYLTVEATSRTGSALKEAAKYLATPGIISLGGGLPSSEYFPFGEISIRVPEVDHFSEAETTSHGALLTAGKHDLAEGKSIFDIATAFNYGQGSGAAQFLRWITEHTEIVHEPPYQDWACTMTVGSTMALEMALRMFAQPGDYVVTEEYTFAAAVDTMRPLGVKVAGVKMDAEGMLPSSLDEVLATWDPTARGGSRKPRLMYTVPSGQNPTGATQGAQRRRGIYAMCQKHDIYILEDDPYYYLQMQPYAGPNADPVPPPANHEEFLKALVPSYLKLDTDGRVMRMDSFSKVLAPGSRVSWITATSQIITLFRKHSDLSTQCPSGIAQLVFFKLLDEHWGHGGYLSWLMHIRVEYTKRRNCILEACEKYLPKEVVSWVAPMAGMFHWMKVEWEKHPAAKEKTVIELEEQIFLTSIEYGSLVMRGSWFYAENEIEHDTLFFRATFAAAPLDKIEEAIRRFGEALRAEFGLS